MNYRKIIGIIVIVLFVGGQAFGALGTSTLDSHLVPKTDNTADIGSSTKELKDLYVDGVGYFDTISFDEVGAPGTPSADTGVLYAIDGGGSVSTLYYKDAAGTATNLLAAGSTAYDDIGDPNANGSIDFTTYTNTWDFGVTAGDMFVIEATANFADISVMKIEQKTGDPTDGTLLELVLAAAETDPDYLSLQIGGTEEVNIAAGGDIQTISTFTGTGLVGYAAGADGNLTVDAKGTGTITFGAISSGDAIFSRDVQLDEDVDLGDASDDTITFTGLVISNITMDDGTTHSPQLILTDQTNETGIIQKLDSADLTMTIAAADSVRVVTGNFRVGNGSPNIAAMDGEDAYIEGDLEVDGTFGAAAGNFSDGNIDNVGNIDLDSISADGTSITIVATAGEDVTIGNSTGNVTVVSDNYDVTLTDTTDNVYQIVNSGGAILLDIDLGATDTIELGDGSVKLIIESDTFDVSNAGNISTPGTIDVDAGVNLGDTTAGSDVAIGNSTGNFTILGDNVDFTLTDATDDVFQLVNSGGAILFDIDLGGTDAMDIGDASVTMAIVSSDWGIDATGAMTNIGAITSNGAISTTSTFDVDGNANISDTTAGADVTIGNSTGNITVLGDNIDFTATDAADDVFQVLNSNGSVVYIDLDLGGTDGLTLGNTAGTLALNSSSWTVSTAGVIENIVSIEFEGSSVDANDTTLSADDPTGNNAITLPDYAGAIPLVIYNATATVDATGVGTTTDITGTSLTLADGWFATGKALRWTIYGRSDGSGGQAMALQIDVDGAAFAAVSLTTSQSDDWMATFVLDEHTDFANQDIVGVLRLATDSIALNVDTDTTDFNDGGTTIVKLQGTTNHANDHIYIDHIKIETWKQ